MIQGKDMCLPRRGTHLHKEHMWTHWAAWDSNRWQICHSHEKASWALAGPMQAEPEVCSIATCVYGPVIKWKLKVSQETDRSGLRVSRPCTRRRGYKYRALLQLRCISRDLWVIFQPSFNPRNWIFHQTLCLTGWVFETLIVPKWIREVKEITGDESRCQVCLHYGWRTRTATWILDPNGQLTCSETDTSRHAPNNLWQNHLFKKKKGKKRKSFSVTKGAPCSKRGKPKSKRKRKIARNSITWRKTLYHFLEHRFPDFFLSPPSIFSL